MNTIERKYDIGNGWTIRDTGFSLTAERRGDNGVSLSIGIQRPHIGPMPDILKAQYSLDGKLYYLHDFNTGAHGFWLSDAVFETEDKAKEGMSAGLFGKVTVGFDLNSEKPYYRQVYYFNGWSIKAEGYGSAQLILRDLPKSDPRVQDYLVLVQNELKEDEKRFNETISSSGRTLGWIVKKIGEWIPVDEIPTVKLED